MRFSIDPPKMPLGTAGPVKKAEKLVGHSEPFIVLNGDIFADINYRELFDAHLKSNALATIALCKVEDPCRYGVAEMTESNLIKRFIEKPSRDKAPSNLINAGVYVLNPSVLGLIPEGRAVSMEREIFPKLAEEGKLAGHMINGSWIDIGKPEEYLKTNQLILDQTVKTLKQRKTKTFQLIGPVALDKGVRVEHKSVIGPYAIIGKNVTIGQSARISNSVIFPNTKIDDFATIDGAIIGEGAHIGKNAQIQSGSIVGDHAKIKENICLSGKAHVCPAREVSENF